MQTLTQQVLKDNWNLFRDINGPAGHQPVLDGLMIISASDLIFLVPLLLLVLWFAFARWSPFTRWLERRFGSVEAQREQSLARSIALTGCLAAGFAILLNTLLGNILFEPRPFVSHPRTVHELVAHVADASFPSDHEAVTGAVVTVLVIFLVWMLIRYMRDLGSQYTPARTLFAARVALPLVLALIGIVLLLLIGVARVYVGLHYPGDIAGGAASGLVAGVVALLIRPAANVVYRPLVRLAEALRLA